MTRHEATKYALSTALFAGAACLFPLFWAASMTALLFTKWNLFGPNPHFRGIPYIVTAGTLLVAVTVYFFCHRFLSRTVYPARH